MTLPKTTWPTSAGATPARFTASRTTVAASSLGGMSFRLAAVTLASQAGYLIEVAGRAPSLHNTQPWRFTVGRDAIELHADPGRRLRVDPDGREIVISCGAALFGLRLAVRSLGRQPVVELLPEPGTHSLARVRLGPAAPMTAEERKLLTAVPHRHTHRGPFEPGPLPDGLLDRLRGDARAEGATLVVVDSADARAELASIAAAAGRSQDRDPAARAETRRWSHEPGMPGQGRRARARLSRPRRGGRPGRCRSATSTWTGGSAC